MGISNPGGGEFTDILKWHDETLAAAGRFDVTGIPPGYTSMKAYLLARSSVAAITDDVYMIFNGDSTQANYRFSVHFAGSTHAVNDADGSRIGSCPGSNSPADYFSFVEITTGFYSGSKLKNAFSVASDRRDATNNYNVIHNMQWENTAAINQVTIQPNGYPTDELVAGSRLQIWLYK